MCGIFSIASTHKISASRVSKALLAMTHRGPDHSSTICSDHKQVAIGHNRLAVRGAANDTQPIWNEDRSMAIAVNGEFYNDISLRKMLESKGHRFRTTSDSEVALHLYEEYGFNFFSYLQGEFAFVIWDGNKQELIAVRDRFGIKPICYTQTSSEFAVSSEAKGLFASGIVNPEWDIDSLGHSLAHQYLPPNRTLFKAIKMVPPAHFLRLSHHTPAKLERYWQPDFNENPVEAEEILDALTESIRFRLNSNRNPAFSLSGGIDSSAVAAISAQQTQRAVDAYCVAFTDGSDFNELPAVADSAKRLGVNLNPVNVDRESMLSDLSDAVYYSEGLAINGQLSAKYSLSKTIHQAGHNVVLSGEGADEAFLGYAHLQLDTGQKIGGKYQQQAGVMLPNSEKRASIGLPQWLEKWPTFLRAKLGIFSHYEPLLSSELSQENLVAKWFSEIREIPNQAPFEKKSAWLWTRSALSSYILKTLADGTEMAHSIEGRLPFLDHHFFKLAFGSPVSDNLHSDQSKMLLRNALRPVLPEQIRMRPKQPFLAPPLLAEPAPKTVKEMIYDVAHSQSFANLPYFDSDKTISWLDNNQSHKTDPAIWTLLSAAMLQDRFQL